MRATRISFVPVHRRSHRKLPLGISKHFNHRLACFTHTQGELIQLLERWDETEAASQIYISEIQEGKNREQATLNRKIELQLASLDTYLVSLDEAKQEEIKAKLADRFFGELPAGGGEGGLPEPGSQ